MPPSICLRSLAQLSRDGAAHTSIAPRSLLVAPQTSSFSTTTARFALAPAKKKGVIAAPKKGLKSLNIKRSKKAGADMGKRPAPGERKALRKRIVLSNNNALEVAGLKDLDKASALSEANEGKMKGIPEDAVDVLRAVEAFKPNQGWSLFRRPAVLMRKETIQLAQLMQEAEGKKTIRRIVAGERMAGKTTMVLQGLLMAYLRGWTVINLPDAQAMVHAHTDYAPLPGSQPTQYTQDTYTATLLSQILKANKTSFSTISITTKPNLPFPLPAKANLTHICELGITNPEASWPAFTALWTELTQPNRPLIFFAIDGLSHIMRNSEYLSADIQPIHAHDLTLVRHFVDCLSGTKPLPNGGVVLAATTASNSPANPALDFSIQLADARQAGATDLPLWNPYKIVDQRIMQCLKDVDILKLKGLSKDEARAVIEYYAESGMLRAKVDHGFVSQRWSLAGMGNIGELERATVRLRV